MSVQILELETLRFDVTPAVAAPVVNDVERISTMSFEEMLHMVRNAPLDHPHFHGETGRHFHATLRAKRHQLSPEVRAEISWRVGY